MKQCIKTNEVVASCRGAMEAGNHGLLSLAEVRNGASLKSRMSRGNSIEGIQQYDAM